MRPGLLLETPLRRGAERGCSALGRHVCLCAMLAVMVACSKPQPLRVGFLGDLDGSTSDIGQEGRNGMLLAVEQANQAGGLHGRQIVVEAQDEARDPARTAQSVRALLDSGVIAIIGTFTSTAALAALPLVDQAQVLLISPAATATALAGLDDHLVRINRTTRENARDYAALLHGRGLRRLAVAWDQRNAAFSNSWLGEFRSAFDALGGSIVTSAGFGAEGEPAYAAVAETLLAARPDGLLFIANAADAARLSQQAARLAPAMPLAAAEWAASDALIEMGGHAVEGLVIAQAFDRGSQAPAYKAFVSHYQSRFGQAPGFFSVATYDATTVLLQALARAADGETPRDAVLRHGPYDGLQNSIVLDRFGDTQRKATFTVVRGGRFEVIE